MFIKADKNYLLKAERMMRGCIFILGIVWVLLSSCSNNNSRNEIAGKPIKLTEPVRVNWVGHWQNEGYKEELLFDLARRFEFENQDIVLNLKFPAEAYSGMGDNEFNLAEIQKTYSDWDIIRINNEVNGIGVLTGDRSWPVKYLVDFSQFEEFRKNSNEAVLSSEMKNKWGGIVPGHALDGNSFVLWCNQEVAEKIGIKIKQFDISTEDFEGYLKAVKEYNQKNNKQIHSISFNDGWLPTYALGLQVFSSLVGDYNELNDPGYKETKIEAWEKTLSYFERLTDFEPLDPQWSKIQYGSDYTRILNGECLFMVNGTWMYNIWQDLDSVNYKKMIPLELPGMQPSKTYIGEVSIPWAVPLNAKNREQAVKFMLYWCRPEVADEWVRNTKSPTGIKGSLVQSEFGFDVYETFDYVIGKKYNGKKIPLNYGNSTLLFGEKNSAIPSYFKEVITGTLTANEAMAIIKRSIRK